MCLPISPAQHKYHEYVPEILELEVFKDTILKKKFKLLMEKKELQVRELQLAIQRVDRQTVMILLHNNDAPFGVTQTHQSPAFRCRMVFMYRPFLFCGSHCASLFP